MSASDEFEENGLQLMNNKSIERTKQRSEIALKQKQLIDELVDFRVKMQNILVLANRLPQGTLNEEFVKRNEGIRTKVADIKKSGVGKLTNSVIDADLTLGDKIQALYKNPATAKSLRQMKDNITEFDGNHAYGCINSIISHKREWEEETADHWGKRAQVQAGKTLKLNALNRNIFQQVDSILEDDARWHKRITILRGNYQIVGEDIPTDEDGQRRNNSIYDDQDFYNSLLNQYAALAMNHNATVIRQRVSKKKEIQRKASKGRRLIYNVHPKLQNFCTPEKYPTPTIDVQQLFASLFGKTAN